MSTTKARPTLRGVPGKTEPIPMWEVVCDHDECGGVVRCVGDEQQAQALATTHRELHAGGAA
jgi:hypothetical protein